MQSLDDSTAGGRSDALGQAEMYCTDGLRIGVSQVGERARTQQDLRAVEPDDRIEPQLRCLAHDDLDDVAPRGAGPLDHPGPGSLASLASRESTSNCFGQNLGQRLVWLTRQGPCPVHGARSAPARRWELLGLHQTHPSQLAQVLTHR